MSSDNHHFSENSDQLKQVEQSLRNLAAAPPRIDRDRLMFLAGRASAEGHLEFHVRATKSRPAWLWPASTATLAATSLALAFTLAFRPSAQPAIVYRDRPFETAASASELHSHVIASRETTIATAIAPEPASPRVPQGNYLHTRDVAFRTGLDAIGSPGTPGGVGSLPATYFELLEGLAAGEQRPDTAPRSKYPSNM